MLPIVALIFIASLAIPEAHAWTEDQSAKMWARRKPKASVGKPTLTYRPLVAAKIHRANVGTMKSFHRRTYSPRSTGYRAPRPRPHR